ncbi:hypothetical protein SUGI_0180960 [Cryptomeria japonica]|nr:hypothetical protein SUGI_0180960 [Cryptomeria japonica]
MSHAHEVKEISDVNEGMQVFEQQDESYDEPKNMMIANDSEVYDYIAKDESVYEVHYVDHYQKDSHVDYDDQTLLNVSKLFYEGSYMHVQDDSKDELNMLLIDEVKTPNNVDNKEVHVCFHLFGQPCTHLMNHASKVCHDGCYNEYGYVSFKEHDNHVLSHHECFQMMGRYAMKGNQGEDNSNMSKTPTADVSDYAYDQCVFTKCFRLGMMKSEGSHIFYLEGHAGGATVLWAQFHAISLMLQECFDGLGLVQHARYDRDDGF